MEETTLKEKVQRLNGACHNTCITFDRWERWPEGFWRSMIADAAEVIEAASDFLYEFGIQKEEYFQNHTIEAHNKK